ncbi:MAG: hypothetical protein JJT94_14335, partial [Bernardetiaceae bacterium]|nr:hypothetical protein [Bernardetiaceae bacterium]
AAEPPSKETMGTRSSSNEPELIIKGRKVEVKQESISRGVTKTTIKCNGFWQDEVCYTYKRKRPGKTTIGTLAVPAIGLVVEGKLLDYKKSDLDNQKSISEFTIEQ